MRSVFFVFLLFLLVIPISAQDGTIQERDAVYEAEAIARLEEINPDAVLLFTTATEAMYAGRNEEAQQGFYQVLEMVPDFPDALRRLSIVELRFENIDKALEFANRAHELDPSPRNQAALALALFLNDQDGLRALTLAQEAAAREPDNGFIQAVLLTNAVSTQNLPLIREASENLVRLVPENPVGHFYLGAVYADMGRWLDSETELIRARELGWPENEINAALDAGISRAAFIERLKQDAIYGLAAWIIAMIGLFVVGSILSNLTLAAIKQSQATGSFTVNPAEARIRSIYRAVIVLATVFFYFSLPIVGLIVIAVALGIIYIFMLIGWIPIQGAVFVVAAGLVSLWAVLRGIYTLFRRPKWQDPGIFLPRNDAPEMWQLVEEVAAKVGTRPVDAIYVIPGAGIAVMERGNLIAKMRDKGQRYLLLGLAALSDMPVNQFKAILAHEYGHFSNRDTAGGDFALQVRISMMETARHLAVNGQATWYNPVWLFLNLFNRIFLRITLGASRLQEVLADRFAVMAYGTQNFVDGLTYIVRRTLQFDLRVKEEIEIAREEERMIANIYTLPSLGDVRQQELDKLIEERINKPTNMYDSHPALHDRIALAEKLQSPMVDNGVGYIHNVVDLLPNLKSLEDNMTKRVYDNIR